SQCPSRLMVSDMDFALLKLLTIISVRCIPRFRVMLSHIMYCRGRVATQTVFSIIWMSPSLSHKLGGLSGWIIVRQPAPVRIIPGDEDWDQYGGPISEAVVA